MTCAALRLDGSGGLADALRALDCRAGAAAAGTFQRLFGESGALAPALTVLLTLFVAGTGYGLLTGRLRIGAATLTPRMLSVGLVLTFATSWAAYLQVVWTLATAAPDQLASVVAGTHGSATDAFARALDRVFAAIADAADAASRAAPAPGSTQPGAVVASPGFFTPTNMLWLSGLLLLLGTVGVLVTSKIVLAALLAIGPAFIVLALFPATRGLFEGWVRGVALFALAPMIAVLVGGGTLAAVSPVIRAAVTETGTEATRAATALFLAACVECALMLLSLRTASVLVGGWRLPGGTAPGAREGAAAPVAAPGVAAIDPAQARSAAAGERARALVAGLARPANDVAAAPPPSFARERVRTVASVPSADVAVRPVAAHRDRLGSRFRAPPRALPKDRLQ